LPERVKERRKEMVSVLDVQAASIAVVNDRFRESGFGVILTQGVQAIRNLEGLLGRVRMYNDFNEGNDPYGEHDFGSLRWEDDKVFWKIDYYDQNMEYGADPLFHDCKRAMTVMLADEY